MPPPTDTAARLRSIDRPTAVVNRARARHNIETMAEKARRSGVALRPHFKTHNSHTVAQLFRDFGVEQITTSNLAMAEYFHRDGWRDITVALPVTERSIDPLTQLARHCRVGVIVDSTDAVDTVAAASREASVWLDIDVGYQRTGVPADEVARIAALARHVVKTAKLRLAGLLTHAGQTYAARSRTQILDIWSRTNSTMANLAKALEADGISPQISTGDTPGCSIAPDLRGPTEVRPGNFVYYDMQQLRLGACETNDLAFAVACPVLAIYPERGEVVLHGGAVHLSKDHVLDPTSTPYFGAILDPGSRKWHLLDLEIARVVSISQEHAVVSADAELLRALRVGQLLYVVPAHACLAANALGPDPILI